jgi:hypothetical protein
MTADSKEELKAPANYLPLPEQPVLYFDPGAGLKSQEARLLRKLRALCKLSKTLFCYPAQGKSLAECLGVTRDQVQKIVRQCKRKGQLAVKKQGRGNNGHYYPFVGLTVEETAAELGLSVPKIEAMNEATAFHCKMTGHVPGYTTGHVPGYMTGHVPDQKDDYRLYFKKQESVGNNQTPFDLSPLGLAQRWCFLLTRKRNGTPQDKPEDMADGFAELIRLGHKPEDLQALLDNPARYRGQYFWQFKDQLTAQKGGKHERSPVRPGRAHRYVPEKGDGSNCDTETLQG